MCNLRNKIRISAFYLIKMNSATIRTSSKCVTSNLIIGIVIFYDTLMEIISDF